MDTLKKSAVLLLSALCTLVSASATAGVVTVKYAGTVTSGFDSSGVFGSSFADLSGLAYTANYTFETTNGFGYSDATTVWAYGGDVYGTSSPALSASLTINGMTFSFSPSYYGEIFELNDGSSFSLQRHVASDTRFSSGGDQDRANEMSHSLYNFSASVPTSTGGSFVYAISAADSFVAYANLAEYDPSCYCQLLVEANVELRPETLTVTPVPEPETYAMMLAGLGLLGLAARRRKRAA